MLVRQVKWDSSSQPFGNSRPSRQWATISKQADNEQQQLDVISALRFESTLSLRLQLWFLIPKTASSTKVFWCGHHHLFSVLYLKMFSNVDFLFLWQPAWLKFGSSRHNFGNWNKYLPIREVLLTAVWLSNKTLFTYLGLITPRPAKTQPVF